MFIFAKEKRENDITINKSPKKPMYGVKKKHSVKHMWKKSKKKRKKKKKSLLFDGIIHSIHTELINYRITETIAQNKRKYIWVPKHQLKRTRQNQVCGKARRIFPRKTELSVPSLVRIWEMPSL